ncbi:alpha/beta fold hydrolase [Spirillospora sp. NBC_00431]
MARTMSEEGKWIRNFHSCPGTSVRLFCFPHAGGSATRYFPLSRSLAPELEVSSVQYPGRQDRRAEPYLDNIPELADRVFEVLRGAVDRPFAMFGHSMGAVLAFEVTRRLEDAGAPAPLRLFVSGRRAPSRHRPGTVHQRDDAGIVAALREVGGTDPRLLEDEEMLATVVSVTRNDYKAAETYRWSPGPPLSCPVTALVGSDDPQTTVDEAAAWEEHTTGEFDLRVLPGGHFYLDARHTDVVDAIRAGVRAASGVGSTDGGMS